MLLNFLDTNLYLAQGKTITNFSRMLPDAQSDLAKETLKDSYSFDFLTLTEGYKERELEDALTANITRFLALFSWIALAYIKHLFSQFVLNTLDCFKK